MPATDRARRRNAPHATSLPSVSVIIPTYNRTRFLDETLESLLTQTHLPTEILVVDDGSSPPFAADLERIARRDPRIAVHRLLQHRGVSAARNLGLERATGDYVLFLDDDDLVPATFFERTRADFDADPALAGVVASYRFLHERPADADRRLLRFDYRRDGLRPGANPFRVFLRSCPPIHAVLLRRAHIAGHRFDEALTYGEDWCFWLGLAATGKRFRFRDDLEVSYRRHPGDSSVRSDLGDAARRLFETLLRSGMLCCAADRVLVHARAYRCLRRLHDRHAFWHLAAILKSPVWAAYYGATCVAFRLRALVSSATRRRTTSEARTPRWPPEQPRVSLARRESR